jgi:peroxiredoxin
VGQAEVGSPAPDVRLLRTDGRAATLRELAGGEPAVLFFLRHYG